MVVAIVHGIAGTENSGRSGDVVFVHGLDGHWYSTWSNGRPNGFWPEWLGRSWPALGVWSLEYDAVSTRWRGRAMPLADRASNVLDALLNEGLGSKPVCFITHSMGGLVIKQVLRYASDSSDTFADHRAFLDGCRGVIFLATPHTGADLASLARFIGFAIRGTPAIRDLEANSATLRDLNWWFLNNARGLRIKSKVYFETRDTLGVRVVDESSAYLGVDGVEVVPLDEDHLSICKPESEGGQVYKCAIRFVREALSKDEVNWNLEGASDFGSLADRQRARLLYRRSRNGDMILIGYVFEDCAVDDDE